VRIGRIRYLRQEPMRCDWCGRPMFAGSNGSGVSAYTVGCSCFCGERCARDYMAAHGYKETIFDHWGWLMKWAALPLVFAIGMAKGCLSPSEDKGSTQEMSLQGEVDHG